MKTRAPSLILSTKSDRWWLVSASTPFIPCFRIGEVFYLLLQPLFPSFGVAADKLLAWVFYLTGKQFFEKSRPQIWVIIAIIVTIIYFNNNRLMTNLNWYLIHEWSKSKFWLSFVHECKRLIKCHNRIIVAFVNTTIMETIRIHKCYFKQNSICD